MTDRSPVILQVLPALGTGGLERGAVEIAAAITQGGGTALVASRPGRLLVQLRHAGGRHIELDLKTKSPVAVLRRALDLQTLIRNEGVDLVHARSRIPAWAAWIACRRENIPLVTTWHGVHEAKWRGKKLYNSVLARGARVIAISEFIGRRLRSEYAVPESRLRVIPRGADLREFTPGAISGERVQKLADAWRVPADAKIILMPARLTAWKGQGVLLEALGLLRSKMDTGWICVLAGPENDRKFSRRLQQRVQELGLEDHVRFAGTCADMPAACELASVVVAPSLRPEPFGRTLVEAQMMGCPVIGTAQGAMRETILPGETGLVVPPDDAEALAGALKSVLETGEDALDWLAEKARVHVIANYTTTLMQARTLGVYDELLGTRLRTTFEEHSHDQ
ncbi:glycosyltransferase family 4 protein [Gluconobacter sphaericus]|uniref:glycosyltransferase family 4 protein n=1 Tax=Gluconobacter sphaericus TaxID=574987 RepID=UPI001B8D5862|nr:glycosyltransferase family 4 protein [Gluconobacter sphaericus]MBS1097292.1 glycosyltransferase family 4 protein [Gluconobacter sphaericus]